MSPSRCARRPVTAALVATLFGALLAVAGPAAATERSSCDQLLLRASTDFIDGQALVQPNGRDPRFPLAPSDTAPASDSAGDPVWRPDGGEIAWVGETTESIWIAGPDGSNRRMVPIELGVGEGDSLSIFDLGWSPDGTSLVFGVSIDGVTDIVVTDADGTDAVFVSEVDVAPFPTSNFSPTWSPDGSRIAWTSRIDGDFEIVTVAPDGSGRTVLSEVDGGEDPEDNFSPTWSPDGSEIAWAGDQEIIVADADGTGRNVISTVGADPDPTSNNSPVWASVGDRIAWIGSDGSDSFVFVADRGGQNRANLSTAASVAASEVRDIRWSHDASQISWQGEDTDFSSITVVADADGANAYAFSEAARPNASSVGQLDWSPVGDRVAWTSENIVFTSDPVGGDRLPVSVPAGLYELTRAEWSPDGSLIALTGRLDGVRGVIVVGADGSNPRRYNSRADNRFPVAWTPDSTSIIWAVNGDEQTLVQADVESGAVSDILAGVAGRPDYVGDPAVTPDGTRLVFSGDSEGDARESLFVLDLDTGDLDVVELVGADKVLGTSNHHVSPDGTAVAYRGRYSSDSWSLSGIFVTELATGSTSELTDPGSDDSRESNERPQWSPDGTLVAWEGSVNGEDDQVYLAAPDGSGKRSLLAPNGIAYGDPRWSPDGDLLAINGWDGEASTVLIVEPDGTIRREFGPEAFGVDSVSRPQWRPRAVTPFTDMPATSFAVDDVACIYGMEITQGTSATTYGPGANVTREQMASFVARLWRALGNDCDTDPPHGFADVAPTSFADDDISCIKNLGITTGTGGGLYSP
ncbi:MAG: S-layer homology domain-containing protein, partial [Actinomycetota bacterium]